MTDQTQTKSHAINPNFYLTVTEVARRLGVTRQRVHQRIQAGSLKAERVPSPTGRFHYLLPADQFPLHMQAGTA